MTQASTPRIGVRWTHIVPNLFVMYTIAHFDRTNVSLALPAIMHDLNISSTVAGLMVGSFFWGYSATFLLGGWLAPRFGPKRVILWCLIFWGASAVATGLVRNTWELFTVRLCLGMAEGPVWTATTMLISQWFTRTERGRAFGLWHLCNPVAALLAGPISGLLLLHHDWRVMLVVEGCPALVWAVVWALALPSSPERATWLPPEEREALRANLAAEQEKLDDGEHLSWTTIFTNANVWKLCAGFSLMTAVSYGFGLWLPSAIRAVSSVGIASIGVLSALPYMTAFIGIPLVAWSSDRRQERRLHAAVAMVSTGLLLFLGANLAGYSVTLQMVVFTAMGFFMYMHTPLIFTFTTELLPRRSAVAAAALIGGIGNLVGGFFGPFLVGWLRSLSGSYALPFSVIGLCGLMGGLLVAATRPAAAPRPAVDQLRRF